VRAMLSVAVDSVDPEYGPLTGVLHWQEVVSSLVKSADLNLGSSSFSYHLGPPEVRLGAQRLGHCKGRQCLRPSWHQSYRALD